MTTDITLEPIPLETLRIDHQVIYQGTIHPITSVLHEKLSDSIRTTIWISYAKQPELNSEFSPTYLIVRYPEPS